MNIFALPYKILYDAEFSASVLNLAQNIPHVPWYRDQYLVDISLASLFTCVLVRTIKHNLFKLQVSFFFWHVLSRELIFF